MENPEVCSSLPDKHFEHASSGTSVHVAAGRIHSFSQKGLPRGSILQWLQKVMESDYDE